MRDARLTKIWNSSFTRGLSAVVGVADDTAPANDPRPYVPRCPSSAPPDHQSPACPRFGSITYRLRPRWLPSSYRALDRRERRLLSWSGLANHGSRQRPKHFGRAGWIAASHRVNRRTAAHRGAAAPPMETVPTPSRRDQGEFDL